MKETLGVIAIVTVLMAIASAPVVATGLALGGASVPASCCDLSPKVWL